MWVPTADLPKSAGHPFYERLNRVLDDAGFDAFVEAQCASFYADGVGRPSLAPGRYFRLLLLGYFEGLDSERAIAWRAADSLSIRTFWDFALHEAPPDHSTLSRTRRLIDLETHQAVFTWVLQRLADATLVVGRTVGIDATTLEANAAMRSIVRRDTGESYDAFLTRLAEASGLTTPTRAELARFDRTRKKKGSNADWTHPHDPDAKIAKMKDGRTHLAHTAEHAVDLETGAIVGVTVQDASAGDTTTLVDTLVTAAEQVEAVGAPGIVEVVADKGYHSNETMVGFAAIGVRSYVSEPDRGRRHWKGQAAARDAVYANRRRIRGARGRLLEERKELSEQERDTKTIDEGIQDAEEERDRLSADERELRQMVSGRTPTLSRQENRILFNDWPMPFRVYEGDTIELRVSERDLFQDDLLGRTNLVIDSVMLETGRVELRTGWVVSMSLGFLPCNVEEDGGS